MQALIALARACYCAPSAALLDDSLSVPPMQARIALARACYCRPSVALLDDPLSAVDPRVGRTLFDKALGPSGLMQVWRLFVWRGSVAEVI